MVKVRALQRLQSFCILCKREFSIAHGGNTDCRQHSCTEGHKRKERDVKTSSNLHLFFGNSSKDFKNVAGELALVFHTVKHNIGYRSMDCANKLSKDIFHDSNLAKKMSCGRTKAEAIVKNVLAPRSVQDFIDVLKDPAKSSNFFSIATDASNHKNRKIFPLVVRYFDPLSGVKNRLLDFIEQADETANATHNLIKSSLDTHKLDIKNLTSYCADNANVNYGKHNSVFKLLQEDNKNVLKANCSNHILHNATKHASDGLDVDIEMIILKIYGHFSVSAKRREELKSFFDFVDAEWLEIVRHVPTRWLSLTSAVDRLIQNWLPIKSYFKSVNDCPKILKKHFSDKDPEKECVIEAYLNFFSNIGAVLVQSAKILETANLSIMECYSVMQCVDNKIQQRIEDRFFGTATEKILNCLNPPLQKCARDDFVNFYCCLHKYISKNFELSNANPVHCLLPLNLNTELSFRHFQTIVKEFNLDFVNEDSLYEEFSSAKSVLNVVKTGHIEQSWVNIFSDLRNKQIDVPNLIKILGFVLSIPGSNAHTERVFSLMSNKWTDQRNQSSLELIKSELMVAINYDYSCKEFFKFAQEDKKMLSSAASVDKYI